MQDNLSLFFNVENVGNKVYNNSASVDYLMSAVMDQGNGRGRTTSFGFTLEY
ncbi:hypothetical protein D3C79_1104020 [compost metagenome]